MSKGTGHAFSELFIHLNWHCKNDRPLIDASMEADLHEFIRGYCRESEGVHLEEVGGTEDHVHVVLRMEPTVKLSEFIGQVKGASAHEMNRRLGAERLVWQRGYGAVSFAGAHLDGMVAYVRRQKEHHRAGTVRAMLERHGEDAGADEGNG